MASNVTVQSVLSKISQDHLECSICSCRFKEPKVLDCLHSFCLKCLQQLSQGSGSTKLTCPLCRHDTRLKGNDVAALPNNFALGALVEEFTIQEQLSGVQLGSEIKCQACEEENPAISRCTDCDRFLCQECQTAHGRLAMLKSHKIHSLVELSSGKNAYKSKLRETPKCTRHPDQIVSMYCNTCETVVCTTCYALHHAKHSLTDLPEASSKCKQDIAELTVNIQKVQTEWSTAAKEVAETRETLDNLFFDTMEKISKKVSKEMTRIKQEEGKLKEEVEKVYKEKLQKLTTAEATCSKERSQTVQKLDDVNRLVARASSCEILNLKEKLFQNLQELTSQKPPTLEKPSAFHFEEGEELSLGKLVLDATSKPELECQAEEDPSTRPKQLNLPNMWVLKTERYGFVSPADVAVFSNDEIVVLEAHTINQQLKTFFPISKRKSEGPFLPQAIRIKGVRNPSRVVVDKHDQLILLDETLVKTFNRKYHLLRQFEASGGSSCPPTCLTVSDNDIIALGYEKTEQISLHEPDGTLIKTLPAPGITDYMTAYREHLIYTMWEAKKVHSLDHNGSVAFSAEIPGQANQQCQLAGVCCDKQGYIFVAASTGDTNDKRDEIHHFSPDGKHLGRVIRGRYPAYGITFSPSCKLLVVAAGSSVKVYHQD